MLSAFLGILPFALAAAISPMMLTEQTLLLATDNGRTAGCRYALGVAFVLLIFVGLLIAFGRAISLPKEPTLNSRLDVILGAVLVLVALYLRRRGNRSRKKKRKSPRFGPREAFGFGAFSMATNFTSLALVIPATKAIGASHTSFPEREALALVLVFIVSTPAWLPLALTAIAPGPTERLLNSFDVFIKTWGRQVTQVLLFALGIILLLRGIIDLL